ncbi:ATP-dependent RecD-like DNA helicase [Caldalkalibacillus horti]|uniref:ATP-dependent RecD2 DNA helicase n=1 Tax=Caldalkalibacillus horti TaxID=77523 RepID=A0ABT9VTB7_9BACI|nr:ATP-dependent RecD-like DNA helicase [Bacillus horti]MDQ0164223.1 exodeoxyribonuclease V alpha subunit [Bacillus horti]
MNVVQSSFDLFDDRKPYIKGKMIQELFHNPESYFTVTRIRISDTTETINEKEIMIVGVYPSLAEDEIYTFWGSIKQHPKYGIQYSVEQFRKEMPQGREGIVHYLSSDLFPGVGKKLAASIVDTLGEQAIQRILEEPDCLREVPKLQDKTRQLIFERIQENQGLEQIIVKLSEYGIGISLSIQIYQKYAERSMTILEENPYELIETIEGIGFKRADLIGRAVGIAEESAERLQAACLYYLREQSEQYGHVFLPLEQYLTDLTNWINQLQSYDESSAYPSSIPQGIERFSRKKAIIDELSISNQIIELGREEKLIIEEDRVYTPSLFYAEKGFAKKVRKIHQNGLAASFSQQEFLKALGELEERLCIEYAETQKQAIEKALSSPFMILTGGPGTGKTTVIRGVCEIYAELHGLSLNPEDYVKKEDPFPILLIAPTGRAAKRMYESTGVPAVTIHRLLGWSGGKEFKHDEDNPIEGKLLIIDESSMMDQWLANQLFRALPETIQILLVGDQDQLPSVGPGQVLRDLMQSERLPVVELQEIYRQAEGSSIITLAHQIKRQEAHIDIKTPSADRRFFACNQNSVVDAVGQICSSAIRKGYTPKDIQVLVPMYKGAAGIDAINKSLQNLFNPQTEGKRQVTHGDYIFRVGDKVLQLANNPEEHVFNGDIGEVVSVIWAKENVDKEDQLVVLFDQKEVLYPKNQWNQLTLAYCCSVHKSQGSEFPIVVVPVVRQYHRMLRRNLIYTAITRARDFLILCGEEQTFLQGLQKQDDVSRHTYLKETLQEWITETVAEANEATSTK